MLLLERQARRADRPAAPRHGRGRRARSASRTRRACATGCARSRRRRSASRRSSHGGGDQDIFGFYREGGFIEAQVLFVRQGKLTGNQAYQPRGLRAARRGGRARAGHPVLPGRALRARRDPAADRARGRGGARRLSQRAQGPARRDPAAAARRPRAPARDGARERRSRASASARTASASTSASATSCGASCICATRRSASSASTSRPSRAAWRSARWSTFDEGQPDKNGYRRFRIKTVTGQDDFAHDVRGAAPPLRRAPSASRRIPTCWSSTAARGSSTSRSRCCASSSIDQVDAVGLAKMRVDARRPRRRRSSAATSACSCPAASTRSSCGATRTRCSCCSGCATRRTASPSPTTARCAARSGCARCSTAIPGVGAERRRRLLRAFGSVKRMRAATRRGAGRGAGHLRRRWRGRSARRSTGWRRAARTLTRGAGRLVAVPDGGGGGGGSGRAAGAGEAKRRTPKATLTLRDPGTMRD